MTRRTMTFASLAILAAVVLYGGMSGTFTKVLSPGAKLAVSGHMTAAQAAPATQAGTASGPATVQPAGAPVGVAKAFTTVSVDLARREASGYAIEARLVGKDGKAMADTEIAFYDVVALLGQREMLIATAKTDGFGLAAVNYLPAQGGTHTINVRPVQWDRLAATQATTAIEAARVAPSTYARERLPLDPFSARLPVYGAAVVLGVWALFALVLLGSAYLIPRGARRSPYMGKAREV